MSIEKTIESINYTNWYSKVIKSGTAVGVSPTGVDPNVQLRIVNGETSSSGSVSYPDFLINPDLTSFEFNTEVYQSYLIFGIVMRIMDYQDRVCIY
jgi:hypothetical protein